MSAMPLTAAQAGLVSCEFCRLLSRPADAAEPGYCPRCGAELVWRRHHSIQYTWALVIAAAICYIPANMLPVLNTTTLGSTDSDTIMGGVVFLYTSGSWPLALIVLIASVMVPLGKLVALIYLLDHGSARLAREQPRADPALSHGRIYRALVDAGRLRRYVHRCPRAALTADVGGARPGSTVFRGSGRANNDRGGVL